MTRQYFNQLRFPGRNFRESLDAHEAQSTLSEGQNNDTFRSNLYEFQEEFAQEEKAQGTGEQARVTDFDQLVSGLNDVFEKNQRFRERSFLEVDKRQEDIFMKNEAGREALFLEGQNSRSVAFKSCQASHVKRSEWHSATRETLLVQGRQRRKDASAAIDAALVDQFNKMLEVQEGSFITEERRRESVIKNLLDERAVKSTSLNDGPCMAFPEPTTHSAPRPSEPSMIPAQLRRPTNARGRSPSRSPRRASIDMRYPVLYSNMRYESSCRLQSPTQAPVIEVPAPVSSDSSHTSNENKRQSISDPSDTRFANAHQERHQAFLDEERKRESRFQAAEAERNAAEVERTTLFAQKERFRSTKFRNMLEEQDEHFRGMEEARTAGIIRREEVFNAAEERQSQMFDMSISQIEKQAEAENSLEENLVEYMKGMAKSLSEQQITRLDAAREDQLVRFEEAQRRRDAELGVTLSISSVPRMQSPRYPPVTQIIDSPLPTHGVAPIIIQQSRSRSRSPMCRHPSRRNRSSSPRRAARSFSPATGFAAGTLFRGPGTQDPLPVPADAAGSQARREEAFERGIQRRRHTFSVNEARRQADLVKKQRGRKVAFEESEDGREDRFNEARRRLETTFFAAERGREIAFHQNEKVRDRMFRNSQKQRDERFHEKQEELQKKCFEAEHRWFADLETWGRQLLQAREREQMEIYKSEEEAREDVFKGSLGAFVLK